ncbi:hypothetical protein [Methyloversatilis discipulorum]|uniref:hypothetical protein n=1 Tax=Methyloversatilis discipulorum TaxID=1119528 RepID=UPI0005B9DAE1|nr:hypothetical protein [Methyloversatilis discipulorum]
MPVQDDAREQELVREFNLRWDPDHQRSGVDATLEIEVSGRCLRLDVEVKSTTRKGVSTARDVGLDHIQRWRRMFFVIGTYDKRGHRLALQNSICLTPLDMEGWIAGIESYIAPDYLLAQRASAKLDLADLFTICGNQATYSIEDAKRLHKRQWTAQQYKDAADTKVGDEPRISQQRMLEILRLRSAYIAERGATLNNPHIPLTYLDRFKGTDRIITPGSSAEAIRRLAREFVLANPDHPALTEVPR